MPIASTLLEVKPAGSWVTIPESAYWDVGGSWELTGNKELAIAFGDDSEITWSGTLALSQWASLGDQIPLRYTTTMDADTTRTFVGVITKRERDMDQVQVEATGVKLLIAATKAYSPMVARRPIATKTTATSVENPSTGGYRAGLINYLWWQAGGRPSEQAGSYPTATFYYSCDHALLAPDWSWAAGEDAWAESLKLAQASGGQCYQDQQGVVRFRQIVGYGGGSTSETFDESTYATIQQTIEPGRSRATKVTCQYLPRRRLGMQQVADDATPRHVEPGETITIVIEPENPVASIETQPGLSQLKSDAIVMARLDGLPYAPGDYTHTLDVAAARVTITVTNASSYPATIWRVRLRGEPIVAQEAGSISAGAGTIERILEQSVYIQSRSDAQRLAEMTLAYYAAARPVVRITDVLHKPARAIGDTVALTCAAGGMSAQAHVIVAISHGDTGAKVDLDLVDVSDLPTASQFHIVDVAASGTKYLGW